LVGLSFFIEKVRLKKLLLLSKRVSTLIDEEEELEKEDALGSS